MSEQWQIRCQYADGAARTIVGFDSFDEAHAWWVANADEISALHALYIEPSNVEVQS